MNKTLVGAIALFSLTLCASCSSQNQNAPGPSAARGNPATSEGVDDDDDGEPGLHGFMAEMDTNKDGKVTADEFKAGSAARFAAADTNHDGELDAAELAAMRKARIEHPSHGGKRGLARIDKDGNGTISRDEAPPRLLEHFDEVDTNHDGALDQQEVAAFHKGGAGPGRPGGRMDANGDGKVSQAEFNDAMDRMFKMMDADGDGVITEADVKSAREKRQKK